MSSEDQKKVQKRSYISTKSEPIDCPICMNPVTDRALTDTCLHEFCVKCIKEWTDTQHNMCPVCRQKYTKIISNIESNEIFTEIDVKVLDNDLIERVAEELLDQLYEHNYDIMCDQLMVDPNGPIAEMIIEIINDYREGNDVYLYYNENKHIPSCVCVQTWLNIFRYYQNLFLYLTHLIVLSFGENMSDDMIQQLVMTIIRNRSEEVGQYLTPDYGEEEMEIISEVPELYAPLQMSAELLNEGTDQSIDGTDQSNCEQSEENNES